MLTSGDVLMTRGKWLKKKLNVKPLTVKVTYGLFVSSSQCSLLAHFTIGSPLMFTHKQPPSGSFNHFGGTNEYLSVVNDVNVYLY